MVALIVALSIVVGIPVLVGTILFWITALTMLLNRQPSDASRILDTEGAYQ